MICLPFTSCPRYSRETGILDQPVQKLFKSIVKRENNCTHMMNPSPPIPLNTALRHMNVFEVSSAYYQPSFLDDSNSKTRLNYELLYYQNHPILRISTVIDQGHHIKIQPPVTDYENIREILVLDVNDDRRQIAKLVADFSLSDTLLHSVYLAAVILIGFRLLVILAELNHLQLQVTDFVDA